MASILPENRSRRAQPHRFNTPRWQDGKRQATPHHQLPVPCSGHTRRTSRLPCSPLFFAWKAGQFCPRKGSFSQSKANLHQNRQITSKKYRFFSWQREQVRLYWSYKILRVVYNKCIMQNQSLRRITMNAMKLLLLVVLLAIVGTVAGCHEGCARENNVSQAREVAWRQGVTGFWQPEITYNEVEPVAQEFSRR